LLSPIHPLFIPALRHLAHAPPKAGKINSACADLAKDKDPARRGYSMMDARRSRQIATAQKNYNWQRA
jgi:hypothetical protein